ncbi:MAG: hypothetical protein COV10_03415 [Candidatus Vogelbacteria bacterium CG10_big_fil_rev_8_21_14_0_10_51_16]|uniref:Bacterial spore germination immunoglobulin-like domain-containing protein n=1 Tax=Candidatus Vogelbacteria bacterium CG10_big_fil_rev_8_21_14_0_10_51_16 TaxID=1975045 RepID=A0A2H0RFZ5_9BACT|nr:MAG: hypothetical protein COV10_03415 [Candidatus Vogelbacteria bacterium CG10_big_fil_rev_8_21_14_0_10_51_16]
MAIIINVTIITMQRNIIGWTILLVVTIGLVWWYVMRAPTPTIIPDETPDNIATSTGPIAYKDLIRVNSPMPVERGGLPITSPLTIEGEARGNWFFEATFPVLLTNWDGLIIAEHYAEAILDPDDPDSTWMTTEYVPFRAVLTFDSPFATSSPDFMKRGSLILQKSNASGLPEHDDALEYVIEFTQSE